MPGSGMAPRVAPCVSHGMAPPIWMDSLIAMEPAQADRITHQPCASRSQVHILSADESYVLVSVPNIRVRHSHRDHRRGHYDSRRLDTDHRGRRQDRAANIHDAAC